MWVSVSNQAYVFLSCVLGGMIIAFVYDIFRVRRKAIKSGNLIVYFEDFIYWIIVALVLFAVVYRSNEGEIRGYLILGVIIGIILYAFLLSRIVMKVFLFLIRVVYKVAVFAFTIILLPIKIVLKLLGFPAKRIYKIISQCINKIKRASRNKLDRLRISKKLFKNIRKKI
ncbi:MAG: spore cortex biosynthesis protein YabQ [Clostridium sp.]|nr:spore cortex biosynthesis protein YabQ [Clostridium sp.]